jgi:hypothetical protein
MVGDFPPLFGGFPAARNLRGVPIFAVPNCNARCSAPSAGSWRGSGSCSGRRKWGVGKVSVTTEHLQPLRTAGQHFFQNQSGRFWGASHPRVIRRAYRSMRSKQPVS